MQNLLKRYLPDGTTRAVWRDAVGPQERRHGVIPQRASRIEVIPVGPQRGRFYVDFTPLAEATGNDTYRVCLLQTFESYSVANTTEVAWLEQNWVLSGLPLQADA